MSHTAVRTKYKGAKLRKMLIPGKTSEMLPTFRFRWFLQKSILWTIFSYTYKEWIIFEILFFIIQLQISWLKARGCCGTSTMNTEFTEKSNKVNSIEGFYAGTGIFITGASGFVGKGLLEKLIRVCPRIVVLFILVRPKKHQTMEQRYKEIMDDPVRK